MVLRYDFLSMMRNRVGAEGVSPEELQAIAGWLEASRRALLDRKKTGELGFFEVPKRRPSREAMASILRNLDPHIDTLVVVGIGGSLLGTQAVYEALKGLEALKRGARVMKLFSQATPPTLVPYATWLKVSTGPALRSTSFRRVVTRSSRWRFLRCCDTSLFAQSDSKKQ